MDIKKNEIHEKILHVKNNKLNFLDLSYCNLTKFPEEVYELYWLSELNISYNFIKNIDSKKFRNLNRIYNFNISNNFFNYFDGLPFELGNSLAISHLDISNNNFIKIPSELRNLNHLNSVSLSGNPFERYIPPELDSNDIETILNYQEEIELSKYIVPLFEGKVIFVGNGDVGKTSLIKKLIDNQYNLKVGEELTTKGISITNWNISIPNPINTYNDLKTYYYEDDNDYEPDDGFENDYISHNEIENDYEVDVELNIWDFGGQEIYHSTHQFFLTKRSIYILVWEERKDEVYSSLDYWLNIISILGSDSPVIVVQNKCELRARELTKTDLRDKFPNIVGFYQVSCLVGSGIKNLKNGIKNSVKKLPHLGDKLPKAWKEIKDVLINMNSDYISYEEYLKICKGFKIVEKKAKFISDYLHDLGVIIHFKNDYLLSDIVILRPEWATRAVYSLLDQKSIGLSNGKFTQKDLFSFWDEGEYPFHKYSQLLRLMAKFELCFNILGTDEYILPELLPAENKSIDELNIRNKWEMLFEYRYSFFPSGIITRLICKINHLIEDSLFSKFSIVIIFERSQCLIIQNVFEKKISIFIYGGSNSETLAFIRSNLASIHLSLNLNKDKEFDEFLSCCCDECFKNEAPHLFQLKVVYRFLDKGKTTIECHKSGDPIIIQDLLKGYRKAKSEIKLVNILINACLKLQGSNLTIKTDENSKNTFLRDYMSHFSHLIIKDQTLWGKSPTGKSPGEIDLLIENITGIPLAIVEAFRLNGFKSEYISSHLDKVFDYDVNGLFENFIVVYAESLHFINLWGKYKDHVDMKMNKYRKLQKFKDVSDEFNCGTELKVGLVPYERNGMRVNIYHLFVNLN